MYNGINVYSAVYCVNDEEKSGIGFSFSLDGLIWSNTQVIPAAEPIPDARVPLELIEENDGSTLFYTDFDARHAGNTGVWEGYEEMYYSRFKLIVTTT